MKFLLDTDHISILQERPHPEFAVLSARMARHAPGDFVYSLVSFHEQTRGGHAYVQRARSTPQVIRGYELLDRVLTSFRVYTVLPFDAAAGAAFDGLAARRLRVGVMDLRIASIALSRGLTVLTRNLRDFRRVPGVAAEDWTV